MDTTTLERMFDDDVRVGQIIHVRGSAPDCDQPSDAMREFAEDEAHDCGRDFEAEWPGYTKRVADILEQCTDDGDIDDDLYLSEVISYLTRECPKQFLVQIESAVSECTSANPKGEGLGTWRGGWGHYKARWYLADSIDEAIARGLTQQRERKVASWKAALPGATP